MDVTIRGLSKAFGQVQALAPTELTIKAGSITTLLGPSGCGKTTLLRLIAGLEEPDAGDILIAGETIHSTARRLDKPVHQRGFGMVFQDFALWPHLTVFENVAFGLRAAKEKDRLKERVMEAIAMVRLAGLEGRYPDQLSGGQQQRVAFARAIVTKPRLVLFDEPLSALDAVLRDELRLELMGLVQRMGLTALYVTHDQTEAMSMSDLVVVMQGGRILQSGAPEEVYSKPAHPFVAGFIGKSNWIEPEARMIRPEFVRFSPETGEDLEFRGFVTAVSYMGERYEAHLEVEALGHWTAYSHTRLPIGESVSLYIHPRHIHAVNSQL